MNSNYTINEAALLLHNISDGDASFHSMKFMSGLGQIQMRAILHQHFLKKYILIINAGEIKVMNMP